MSWEDQRRELQAALEDLKTTLRNELEPFLPDFDSTATGYIWLDTLTLPYWRWKLKRMEKNFIAEVQYLFPDSLPVIDISDLANGEMFLPPIDLTNVGFDDIYDSPPWSAYDEGDAFLDDESIDGDYEVDIYGDYPDLEPFYPDTDTNRPPDRRP